MKAYEIKEKVGGLSFLALTSSDHTTRSSRVEGVILSDGTFEGRINFASGYHISASPSETVKTPATWKQVEKAMGRQSGWWEVTTERAPGDAKIYGYTEEIE